MTSKLLRVNFYVLAVVSCAVSLFDLPTKISSIEWMTYRRILSISQLKQGRA